MLKRLKPLLDNFIREDTQRTGRHTSLAGYLSPCGCSETPSFVIGVRHKLAPRQEQPDKKLAI